MVETGPRTVVVDEGSDLEVSRALANATGQSKVGDGEGLVRGGELEDPSLVLLELACLDVSILVELRLNCGASSHLCSGGSSPHLRPGDRPSKPAAGLDSRHSRGLSDRSEVFCAETEVDFLDAHSTHPPPDGWLSLLGGFPDT